MKIYDESFVCNECRRKIEEYSSKNRSRTIRSWFSLCGRCRNDIDKKHQEEIADIINFYEKWIAEKIAELESSNKEDEK